MSAIPTPHAPAERFARLLATLLAMLGARLERPGKPGLAGPLIVAIATRLHRIGNRLAHYAARWRAGTLAPPRRRPSVPRRRNPAAKSPDIVPHLPRGKMWLVRLVPGIGIGANHLSILLDDPDMVAMIQAAPQIGRTLRPLWHMLSKDPLPDILRPPRPVSAPPSSADSRSVPPANPPPARPSRPPDTNPSPAPEVAAPACLLPACLLPASA